MEKMTFNCSICGHRISIPVTHLGKVIKCPHCGKRMLTPPAPQSDSTESVIPKESNKVAIVSVFSALLGCAIAAIFVLASLYSNRNQMVITAADGNVEKVVGTVDGISMSEENSPNADAQVTAEGSLQAEESSEEEVDDTEKEGAIQVSADSTAEVTNDFHKTLSAEEVFELVSPAVVTIEIRDSNFGLIGQGTGFFVNAEGIIATNAHVIKNAYFASAKLSNGAQYPIAGVVGKNERADVALLKVEGSKLPYLHVVEEQPKVGSRVYAVGNPLGLTNTISQGLISGLRNTESDLLLIQTTAAISPGSSGGPLVDAEGKVVGVTTKYLMGGQNLNFAVPAESVTKLLQNPQAATMFASAGGKALNEEDSDKLDEVWKAIDKKEYGQALQLLSALHSSLSESPGYWFACGYVQGNLENYDLALQDYKKVIEIDPSASSAYYNIGLCYEHLDRIDQAAKAYATVIKLNPDDIQPYYVILELYLSAGRFADAVEFNNFAISTHKNDWQLYYYLGRAYLGLSRYDECIAASKTANLLYSDKNGYGYVYVNMAVAYHGKKELTKSNMAWRRAAQLLPKVAFVHKRLGLSYSLIFRNSDAIKELQKAIELDAEDAESYLWLGSAYHDKGEYKKAVKYYRLAKTHDADGSVSEDAGKWEKQAIKDYYNSRR